MLFWVCDSACVPLVWVMVVGVWCSGWCCFQWCVAVVLASSVVPGVLARVGWLVLVGVCGLVCVAWFRMLTCLVSFFLLVLFFVLSCCLVNNGLSGCVGAGGCLFVACLGWCGCVLCVFWGWLVVVFVCGRVGVFCGRVKVCLFASCGLLGCCLCVGFA